MPNGGDIIKPDPRVIMQSTRNIVHSLRLQCENAQTEHDKLFYAGQFYGAVQVLKAATGEKLEWLQQEADDIRTSAKLGGNNR